jgi:hypothetical protein
MGDRSKSPPTAPEISSLDGHRVRYLSWGIFTVACDDQDSVDYAFFSDIWQCCNLSTYKEPFLSFVRLLCDLWRIAPWQSLEYYSYTMWMIISPAISSYFCYLVLNNVSDYIGKCTFCQNSDRCFGTDRRCYPKSNRSSRRHSQEDSNARFDVAALWDNNPSRFYRAVSMIQYNDDIPDNKYVLYLRQYESRVKLGPHLRAYFLPKLVKGPVFSAFRWALTDVTYCISSKPRTQPR